MTPRLCLSPRCQDSTREGRKFCDPHCDIFDKVRAELERETDSYFGRLEDDGPGE